MSGDLGSNVEQSARSASDSALTVAPATSGADQAHGRSGGIRQYLRGDLGPFPVIVALVLLAVIFQFTTSGIFLTPRNISESVVGGESLVTAVFALGAVLVLLIGEIDLSLAVVGTLCAYAMAILTERHGVSAPVAILAALFTGVVIGLINGFFVAVMRMPSFIVTLAGLIGYQGLIERLGNKQQTIPISNGTIDQIFPTSLCPGFDSTTSCTDPLNLGIVLPLLGLAAFIGYSFYNRRARTKAGLIVDTWAQFATRLIIVIVAAAVLVGIYTAYRGFPQPAMILVFLIVILWVMIRGTAFGISSPSAATRKLPGALASMWWGCAWRSLRWPPPWPPSAASWKPRARHLRRVFPRIRYCSTPSRRRLSAA
jgi:D-xylose transport system permease protein